MKQPSEKILEGRRCLEQINALEILEDLKWESDLQLWYLLIEVRLNEVSKMIAPKTKWYITIDNDYPQGSIDVYPAVNGGINETFYHQNNNGLVEKNSLWRKGKICVKNPLEDVAGIYKEPMTTANRLVWNAERTIEWISKANSTELISNGEFFEAPDFNTSSDLFMAYNEDMVSLLEWESAEQSLGIVSCVFKDNKRFAFRYSGLDGSICKETAWGKWISDNEKDSWHTGVWVLLKEVPVINVWQAPNTFGQLRSIFEKQGLDFKAVISNLAKKIRDGKRHPLFIGFPIPEKFGGETYSIMWQICLLPILSFGKKTAKGFRTNEKGWQQRDFSEILLDTTEISWGAAQNWNGMQVSGRGQYSSKVNRKRFIIIGAGAIGCQISEQLVRAGVTNLLIFDDDIVEIGNLCRHSLSINDVREYKAIKLAEHLNVVNCHARVKANVEAFSEKAVDVLNDYDVIIDCTANDDVITNLSQYECIKDKNYCSVSVGYRAERLYLSYHKGKTFDLETYYVTQQIKISISCTKTAN